MSIPCRRGLVPQLKKLSSVRLLSALSALCPGLACAGAPLEPTTGNDSDEARANAPAQVAAPEQLRPDAVLFALRNKRSEARRCFEQSSTPGSVHLAWQVTPLGDVEEVELVRSDSARDSNRCLVDFASNLRFDRRDNRARAEWTFVYGLAGPNAVEPKAGRSRRSKRRGSDRNSGPVIDKGSAGKLPLDAIENVADHGFRLYAHCMRDGLNRNETLSGRVFLEFQIDPRGRVRSVNDAGSDLPDPSVIDCVAEGFYAMEFPAPSGGEVQLRYAILLNEE
jgi:hypothetical protein